MVTRVYLMVETRVGATRHVATSLREFDGFVERVDVVTGPYDIIAVLQGENMVALGGFITEQIHLVPGVIRTVTCVAVPLNNR